MITKTNLLVSSISAICFGLYFVYRGIRRQISSENPNGQLLPPVYIIRNASDWKLHAKNFLGFCYKRKILGVDCEWVSDNKKRKAVALLQIATAEDACLLIRLNQFEGNLPEELGQLLDDQNVLKLGVGVHDDAIKLFQDYNLRLRGYLDLRFVVDQIDQFKYIERKSLKHLSKVTLGLELEEHWKIRCSDWEAVNLSKNQISYAAHDAVAAALIYKALMVIVLKRWWRWNCPSAAEMFNAAWQLHSQDIDRNYNQSKTQIFEKLRRVPNLKKLESKAYSTRSKPLYHNCHLQAPDGEALSTCDIRKARWYLERGLGTLISEEPNIVVRLNFEPTRRPMLDEVYYIQEKDNKCVVCGFPDAVIRKTVVPHEYRKFFPRLMKAHLSHDFLLLCVNCHIRSNTHDAVLRQQLADECQAPIGKLEGKYKEDSEIQKIRSAGRALKRSKNKLPLERRLELETIVREYFGVDEINDEINDEIIKMAANWESHQENDKYLPHGQKVVQHYCQNDGLFGLEIRWRQHFLDVMRPQYLPPMWSVNHNHQMLAIKIKENPETGFDAAILGLPTI